jgi:hypothetical protein
MLEGPALVRPVSHPASCREKAPLPAACVWHRSCRCHNFFIFLFVLLLHWLLTAVACVWVQLRAGEGLRQRRGVVVIFVMLGAAAAVALMASVRKPAHVALGAMTQDDADEMFRNGKKLG